ncbi:hypothetical protein BJ742DRAFT_791533 [Cladochytrium replicatum]|nr:hypothetical protein BJ742DRAFT_791533 [Cladochytrium replicatum]
MVECTPRNSITPPLHDYDDSEPICFFGELTDEERLMNTAVYRRATLVLPQGGWKGASTSRKDALYSDYADDNTLDRAYLLDAIRYPDRHAVQWHKKQLLLRCLFLWRHRTVSRRQRAAEIQRRFELSAVFVQSRVRQHQATDRFLRLKWGALLAQSCYRTRSCQNRYVYLSTAAFLVQEWWRATSSARMLGAECRERYLLQKRASIRIQRWWHSEKARIQDARAAQLLAIATPAAAAESTGKPEAMSPIAGESATRRRTSPRIRQQSKGSELSSPSIAAPHSEQPEIISSSGTLQNQGQSNPDKAIVAVPSNDSSPVDPEKPAVNDVVAEKKRAMEEIQKRRQMLLERQKKLQEKSATIGSKLARAQGTKIPTAIIKDAVVSNPTISGIPLIAPAAVPTYLTVPISTLSLPAPTESVPNVDIAVYREPPVELPTDNYTTRMTRNKTASMQDLNILTEQNTQLNNGFKCVHIKIAVIRKDGPKPPSPSELLKKRMEQRQKDTEVRSGGPAKKFELEAEGEEDAEEANAENQEPAAGAIFGRKRPSRKRGKVGLSEAIETTANASAASEVSVPALTGVKWAEVLEEVKPLFPIVVPNTAAVRSKERVIPTRSCLKVRPDTWDTTQPDFLLAKKGAKEVVIVQRLAFEADLVEPAAPPQKKVSATGPQRKSVASNAGATPMKSGGAKRVKKK